MALERGVQASALTKRYDLTALVQDHARVDWVRLAERDGSVVGLAAVVFELWNRRARLEHLYVDARARGMGVGRVLVEAAAERSRAAGMRCLWAETQTVNACAVDFYRHVGFTWCGLDASLYDPAEVDAGEVALFFTRALGPL